MHLFIPVQGYVFEYSILFHGYYDSGSEPHLAPSPNPNPYIGLGYNLPLAYISVTICMFVVSTIALLFRYTREEPRGESLKMEKGVAQS